LCRMVELVGEDYCVKAAASLPHSILGSVDDAAEADGGGAVAAGSHEEKFFVFVEAIGLREIPDGA